MFRSDCAIFMPNEYAKTLKLRLDTNIIFYEKDETKYSLFDRFAINGGTPIVLKLGNWEKSNGVQLQMRMNRWERRTDLMGATFHNSLWSNAGLTTWADFIYDENATITGSWGWVQETLFYMTDQLNLTVITNHLPIRGCAQNLWNSGPTDVCSGGMPVRMDGFSYTLPIDVQPQTLLAGVPSGTAPEAMVYIEVFGYLQWSTFFSALLVISLGIGVIGALSNAVEQIEQRPSVYEGFVMTSMFFIQQGSHPGARNRASQRVLALTTSILTMMLFIYYANDITAKMTAGSPPIPIRTFEDVLERGYKVIVASMWHNSLLEQSQQGGAKRSVFERFLLEDSVNIIEYRHAQSLGKSKEQFIAEGGKELPGWHLVPVNEAIKWAGEQIINDPKTVLYCAVTCVDPSHKGKVIALEMDDTYFTMGGLALRPYSEYLSVFNHYMLKAFETGIRKRLDQVWNSHKIPPLKIGMAEPEPLAIKNVMFPFSCLGVVIIISLGIALMEQVQYRVKRLLSESKRGRVFLGKK